MDIEDLYDDSPEVPLDAITDDLHKLTKEHLLGRYKFVYNALMKHKGMTPMIANAVALCTIIGENNQRLLSLLEEMTGQRLPG